MLLHDPFLIRWLQDGASGELRLTCRPSKWLWGLPVLVFVMVMALIGTKPQIENDLERQAAAALQDAGLPWATASFDGRDAVLEGLSFSREERDKALRAIGSIWGVRTVVDKSDLVASPETYTWLAVKEDGRIKLRGHIPTQADKQAVLGFIKAAMPGLQVDDKTMLAGGSPPRQKWLGAVSFALVQLDQLKSGSVRLSGTDMSVRGEAKSTRAYGLIKALPNSQLPAGTRLDVERVSPPVVLPYTTTVKFSGRELLFSGHVISEEARAEILRRARSLFPDTKIEDITQIASGAPDEWRWALSASLIQLRRLESGRIDMEDSDLALQGVAADAQLTKDVAEAVRLSFPATFKVSEKISVREEPPPDKAHGN